MILAIPAVFIAQLYSPIVLWVVSFSIIIFSPAISFLKIRNYKIYACVSASFIINLNYFLHIPYGNPIYEIALYGVSLFGFIILCLLIIVYLTDGIRKLRLPLVK